MLSHVAFRSRSRSKICIPTAECRELILEHKATLGMMGSIPRHSFCYCNEPLFFFVAHSDKCKVNIYQCTHQMQSDNDAFFPAPGATQSEFQSLAFYKLQFLGTKTEPRAPTHSGTGARPGICFFTTVMVRTLLFQSM
jgi:hypothetical protein